MSWKSVCLQMNTKPQKNWVIDSVPRQDRIGFYFIGEDNFETKQRCESISGTTREIVLDIQRLLHQHNSLVRLFRMALELKSTHQCKLIIRTDKTPVEEHERRFKALTVNEVAIVMVANESDRRDIIIQKRGEGLERIEETH
ncbi:hypothetical protein AVEN_234262-1 [Araneus ventricosus]|uniref:Uncharacterized protein n=1 Tax=Araneus ventricosus TaxID=182803 RepID=A0A4Y2A7W2_ARAVE|nr:hypothetical protein AVEN_234262-1 [Araneus ventricosus]